MMQNLKKLSHEELLLVAQEMQTTIASLEQKQGHYEAQIRVLLSKLFKRKSEKIDANQLNMLADLFNETEVIFDENKNEEVAEDVETTKPGKKSGKNKNHLRYGLVEKETIIEHLLSEAEMICPNCGEALRLITKQIANSELVYHRGYYERIVHVQGVYECVNKCEPTDSQGYSTIVKAQLPTPLLPKCCASPSLIASIVYNKFEKSLPLYRQEMEFESLGIKLTRQTMSNWIMKLYDIYLKNIMAYMTKELKKSHLLLLDETRVEVLQHPDCQASPANSYVWVARTGRFEPKQIALFEYKLGRNYKYAEEMVEGYEEIIQSDAYQAYDKLNNIHIGCWQHMRRKFTDTLESLPKGFQKNTTQAYEFVKLIDKMYAIERKIKNSTIEERENVRKTKTKEIMDEFFEKVEKNYELLDHMPGNKQFKDAIVYAHNQEEKLRKVIEYGEADLSSNLVEGTIRNFAVGRKNWLFFNTVSGAQAGTALYSIVVTAKLNGLKSYEYLEYLLDNIRNIDMEDEEALEKLMPWSSKIPENIKKDQKA